MSDNSTIASLHPRFAAAHRDASRRDFGRGINLPMPVLHDAFLAADWLADRIDGTHCAFNRHVAHGPVDRRTFLAGDLVCDVDTGNLGEVVRDFGNGITRVRWTSRYDLDIAQESQPIVTDIGTVRLSA